MGNPILTISNDMVFRVDSAGALSGIISVLTVCKYLLTGGYYVRD